MRKHWKLLPRVLHYLRPYRRLGVGSCIMTLLGAIVALAAPWPLAFLVDSVLGGNDGKHHAIPGWVTGLVGEAKGHLIVFAALAGLTIALITGAVHTLTEFVNTKLSQRMVLDFRSDLFGNAARQSLAYHDSRRSGDFIARINYESSAVGNIATSLPNLAQNLLTLCGMAYIVVRLDVVLALLALLVVPFIYYATGYYGTTIEPRLRRVRGYESVSLTIVLEAMSMLRVIAAFGRERYEHRRFVDQGSIAVNARVRLTVRQTLFSLAVGLITAAGTALVLGVGAMHVVNGRISVGELLVIMAYVQAVYGPLEAVSHTLASLQEQFIFLALALELVDADPEIKNAPDAIHLAELRGDIRFEDVGFTYEGREQTLQHVSLEVPAGGSVALVGPTGAGKTTMMSLLPRFIEAGSGRVLIDGHDVRELTLECVREQIALVAQEPMLFSGTIAENIRYGRLDATDEEIEQAARAANAHEFIAGLPHGYETVLGEKGAQLSGGERQRICVARAFLKDAPILVLDEPTSSIDSRTEQVILDALDRLMVGRTTFMIAHRLSTVRHVDQIVVLDHGRIVQVGTHEQLLGEDGLYRRLCVAQTPAAGAGGLVRGTLEGLTGVVPGQRRDSDSPAPVPSLWLEPAQVPAGEDGEAVVDVRWRVSGVPVVQVRLHTPDGQVFAETTYDATDLVEDGRSTGPWVGDGMEFYLVRPVENGPPEVLASARVGAVEEVAITADDNSRPAVPRLRLVTNHDRGAIERLRYGKGVVLPDVNTSDEMASV